MYVDYLYTVCMCMTSSIYIHTINVFVSNISGLSNDLFCSGHNKEANRIRYRTFLFFHYISLLTLSAAFMQSWYCTELSVITAKLIHFILAYLPHCSSDNSAISLLQQVLQRNLLSPYRTLLLFQMETETRIPWWLTSRSIEPQPLLK